MEHIADAYWSNNDPKPEKITRDHRGTLIENGLHVAYNRSGSVDIGVILSIPKNEWKERGYGGWLLNFEMQIQAEDGHISKIKNPNSFVII
jgi:hypothetical protein